MNIVLKTLGVTLLVVALVALFVVTEGFLPTHADEAPSFMEKWIARKALHAALEREAPQMKAPIPADEANLSAGLNLYKVNCLLCHGASDGEASDVAAGLYQKPPQFAMRSMSDDPMGKIYWFIRHGVRLTGMPAFRATMDEKQLWQVTLFLRQMDALPPSVQMQWKAVPGAAEKE